MTSKSTPVFFITLLLILGISTASCVILAPMPTAIATSTATSSPTKTPTSTTTSSPTPFPLPTTTYTAVPTETGSQSDTSVQSRDQFEEWVVDGKVKCQGSETVGQSALMRLIDEVVAAGIIEKGQLTLGSGVPSTQNPTQCLFLITFKDGKSVIIYKDSETSEFVQLPIVE